ncbi:MAG: N-acetylmuramoyl-L-alanine amidase [Herpetosiphon sp.]
MRPKRLLALIVCAFLLCSTAVVGAEPAAPPDDASLQAVFAAAAHEFTIPPKLLLAVAYNESRWEQHGGQPSTAGGYGVMHLTEVAAGTVEDGKGTGQDRPSHRASSDSSQHTLLQAAQLLGLPSERLRREPVHNIRGGAALLAQYARETVGKLPNSPASWYGAVARYSQSLDRTVARDFADAVFLTLRNGARRTTSSGETITLPATDVVPDRSTLAHLHLLAQPAQPADCPSDLTCRFIPAAYTLNDPKDPTDYGNYDVAERGADGLAIRYIVIHDTELPYNATIAAFQNPKSYVSSHYVLRSADGLVTQMVANTNVAYGAGNWYFNIHGINIEHEGVAIEGAAWYNETLYRTSARLVRYLADKYNIPLDRSHILGHDDVPGPTAKLVGGMHWDPGPFWDWAHYMTLLGAPIAVDAQPETPHVVTINPEWATNRPTVSYCVASMCGNVPPQSTSFVHVYTAPRFDAPLVADPALPNGGTTRANDWGDKAAVGQQFYRAAQQGDWDGIYYGGKLAWLYNPGHTLNAFPSGGALITPAAGKTEIPVYGRAYPEAAAYPAAITPEAVVPLQYSIPAGQIYVATELVRPDFYWSPTQTQHAVIQGETPYYTIFFNHRLAFVQASDVEVVWQPIVGGVSR